MKKSLFMVLFFVSFHGLAQELNCTVTLVTDQIKKNQLGSSAQIFNEIRNITTDFMNNKRWTKDDFATIEKINCAITINLTEATAQGAFNGNATLTLTRPIFGTSLETTVFRFIDRNFTFSYQSNTPLDFNENQYTNNLTHILGFYANLILAFDYDSYSKLGGNPYVQKLQNIVNIASADYKGWKSLGEDTRNRYWIAENLNSPLLVPIREGLYNYHRLALDNFSADASGARKKVLALLTKMNEVNILKPSAVLISGFFDTKNEEIYNIFSQAASGEKQKAFTILTNLDPAHTELYRKLL